MKSSVEMMKRYMPVTTTSHRLSTILPSVPLDVLQIPLQEVVSAPALNDSERTLCDTINSTVLLRCHDRLARFGEIHMVDTVEFHGHHILWEYG